jgi:Na+/proline symporter
MTTLAIFVILYLATSIAIGLFASRRVKTSGDYANAGRSLPLYIVIATVFATWFGSETVLGIPAKFVKDGLGGVIEDPFGASMCLVLSACFSPASYTG